ncbi:MAG: hypothetical protein WAT09_09875 [Paracoccaceae bacterium]
MGRISYDFSGETVLVTGASRGTGYGVARGFALAGADGIVLSSGGGIHAAAARPQRTGRSEADLPAEIVGAQVLPGLLEPDDMAALYLYLASDGARDITGQAMMLERGEVMA